MTTPTIADYLNYANLQMAAEAFLKNPDTGAKNYTGDNLIGALIAGNNRALRFTASEATKFESEWTVVDQCPNTTTGFSGTLFQNKATEEFVISFRSTEFIDDAVRDSAATNTLEVHDTGFAWGQLSDMETWYASIKSTIDKPLSVTGYSLGGHLATVFNQLHPGAADQVITFNGAGVGKITEGTLADALDYFANLRANPDLIKGELNFTLPEMAAFYDTVKAKLADQSWTALDGRNALRMLIETHADPDFQTQGRALDKALTNLIALQKEAARIHDFVSSDKTPKLIPVRDDQILAETLDYQLAVYLAAQNSQGATLIGDVFRIADKKDGKPPLKNQYDLVGIETSMTAWSAVSFSQFHYGQHVSLFIEDQPATRGNFVQTFVEDATSPIPLF